MLNKSVCLQNTQKGHDDDDDDDDDNNDNDTTTMMMMMMKSLKSYASISALDTLSTRCGPKTAAKLRPKENFVMVIKETYKSYTTFVFILIICVHMFILCM
jgi:hypothetical protein